MSAVSKESILQKVDLHPKTNNAAHHTVEVSEEQLILRRGQAFILTLHLTPAVNIQSLLPLTFTALTGEHPSENQGTLAYFSVPDGVGRSPEAKARWKAEFQHGSPPLSSTVVLSLTPPADAPIGEYTVNLKLNNEDGPLAALVLLFNPWCPDDSVFLSDEDQRQEYVMNEQGILYNGSRNYINAKPWDFGQFEDDMVKICMKMLNVSHLHKMHPAQDVASRCDPVYISRLISAMINSEDDCGVLEGRWEETFEGGVRPTHWTGSHQILKQWSSSNCRPVKYGQCWVFASVMCSVMRLLGVPSRVVTNFNSAHDTNENLTIDVYHTSHRHMHIPSYDSIWNFHVWVESWMTRPDLAEDGRFDGWQVVDPTPQELSDGVYCCGPASVKSILTGNTDHNYDVPFVFAEVNADCVDWLIRANGSARKMFTDSKRVGMSISTKSVGSNKRMDITDTYKHREGTLMERLVFEYAITRDFSNDSDDDETAEEAANIETNETREEAESGEGVEHHQPNDTSAMGNGNEIREDNDRMGNSATATGAGAEGSVSSSASPPQLSMRFKEVSKPVNGGDVQETLIIRSHATASMSLSIEVRVCAMLYNGKPGDVIQSEDMKGKTLLPGEDLSIPVVVKFSDYWKPMLNYDSMRISAFVSEENNPDETLLAESDVVLKDPPLKLTFSRLVLHQEGHVEVLFENRVSQPLTQCTLTLSGSGLFRDAKEIQLPDLIPNRRVRVRCPIIPYKAGKKTLVADFDCSVFRDIKKSHTVVVES